MRISNRFYIRGKSRFFRNFTPALQVTRCKFRNFLRHIKIFSQLFTTMTEDFAENSTTINQRIALIVEQFAGGNNSLAAKNLSVSEGTIRSYRLSTTPKADVLEKIVITYEVNAMWLLTGVGDMQTPNASPLHSMGITPDTTLVEFFKQFDPMIQQKDEKLLKQAEEIGMLKQRIVELERQLQKSAVNASTGVTANVG